MIVFAHLYDFLYKDKNGADKNKKDLALNFFLQ